MYMKRSTAKKLRMYRAELRRRQENGEDCLADIWNGEVMRSERMKRFFEGSSDNERAIALQFSLDGVQTHKLGFNEVWPFICFNLNLPLCERFQEDNILPLAVTPGPHEPVDIDTFISPMVDELQRLSQDGVRCYDAYAEEYFNLKVHIVMCTGDTPAIAKLTSMKKVTARHPCRICKTSEKYEYHQSNIVMKHLKVRVMQGQVIKLFRIRRHSSFPITIIRRVGDLEMMFCGSEGNGHNRLD